MDVTPLVPNGLQVIDSYGPGLFRVAGELWHSSIIVMPERTCLWAAQSMTNLSVDDISEVTDADPAIEILLIGCGERMEMVLASFKQACRTRGVGVDTMDTGAACRTYNVLMAEGRRVAAALLPLKA
ncbi:MAG: Mth938-like domain-containing protein [Proteobacteria bacterium]|nr:Mth938-like domain-containing protein [Pseudomonadota bacterium]